jgi:acetyl-CoA carboxylase carboxyltransferase component
MAKAEDWGGTLDELTRRRRHAHAMGGAERLAKHHGKGKLDARARLEHLLDKGSFREFGTLVGGEIAADGIVAGSGLLNGSPVMVGAEDFTTLAGSIGPGGNAKRYRLAELALRDKVPLVMLLEGAGFRPSGEHYGRTPTDLLAQAQCSGKVPTVAGLLGPSAGHGALVAPVCDFTIMSRQGAIFTAGPPVVKESTGEDISKEDLGGPRVALASGVIHNLAEDDEGVLDDIRRYLSYFPSSAWSYPSPSAADETCQPRPTPELLDIVPRGNRCVYDMRAVLDVVFDRPDWFEVQPKFGPAIICALAHLGGHPVAVVANQPNVLAGSIDADAADKAAHFIMVADSFHLPIVFLADNPGMLPGSRSEKSGVLRSGARMFAAQTAATTLKLHVTLRKAYGFGSMVMSLLGFDNQSATFAFPGATMGAMSAAALSRASHAAEDVESKLRKMEVEASFRSASHFGFDDLIHPQETREALFVGVAARNIQPAGGSGTGEPHRHHALVLSDFGALAYAQRVLARRNHSCLRPRTTLLNGNSA